MKTANTKFIPLLLPPLRFFLPFLIISFHSPDFYAQVSTPYIKYTYDSLPVLYYLHGSGENYINESSWAQLWNKSMEDSFPEMVIVLVNPVIENYYYQKTEATVVNELRTHIIQTYRVSDMGECTAICGFSLGGQGAMQLPLNHSGFFSQTVVLAGAPFQDIEAHISNYKANGTGNLNIRITVGTEECRTSCIGRI